MADDLQYLYPPKVRMIEPLYNASDERLMVVSIESVNSLNHYPHTSTRITHNTTTSSRNATTQSPPTYKD
jgi:hypothetical protein